MTEYKVAGETITITTAEENYRQYNLVMKPYLNNVKDEFNSWFSGQGSMEQVDENAVEFLAECWQPIVEKAIEFYNNQNVFSVDAKMLLEENFHDCAQSFYEIIDTSMDKIYDIDEAKGEAKEYRKMRKDSRSRMVGMGFGFKGTVKGMAKAGAFNAATGTAHSLANAVGNMGTALAASANKMSIYHNSKEPLREALYDATDKLIAKLRQGLSQRTNLEFKFVTQDEGNRARAIIKNYKEGNIPEDKRKSNILAALELHPYIEETYKIIWNEYGDISGDLIRMANYFGVPLESYVYNIAINECNRIFTTYCGDYEKLPNKISAGIKIEQELKKAYELICQYVKEHNLEKSKITKIAVCEEAFALIDRELKEVDGVNFESREEAARVRNDKKLFYDYLKDKNLQSEEVRNNVKLLTFESAYYRENCEMFIQDEIERKDPTKLYDQIEKIVSKYFKEKESVFDVNYIDDLSEKEEMIRKITGMPRKEKIIALFDESENGKKGIMITNNSFRIFEKGKILGENICVPMCIMQTIICLGDSKYLIPGTEKSINFRIKSEYKFEFQNILCKCLNELVFVIKNLSEEEQMRLEFFSPKSIVCQCGELMAENNTICTKCRRKYLGNGEFAETIACPSCGQRIVKGKKFCATCGERIPENFDDTMSIKVRYCKNCGSKLKVGQKFCNQCGMATK